MSIYSPIAQDFKRRKAEFLPGLWHTTGDSPEYRHIGIWKRK